MKKIAPGTETSNVLVGETDYLSQEIVAFIRLKEAVVLGEMTEVPVPTRFLFILLGMDGKGPNYRETGRSMATLMSDEQLNSRQLNLRFSFNLQVFHEVAYRAKNHKDILAGVDEFLSCSTVLPPGEWDPSIRIEPPASVPSQVSDLKYLLWKH
ncbi:Electroneutral sodium bicarbonate exchanger 1 [Cichlidogyrus casuarinus]|uniref:Electroneutral sodium bicarbonate exchanger 1 n=1 Tax=Cichlidogyrus casuarinus TaxID=1844966 RepID=A0ABD2Q0J4_9PLAT